MPIPVSCSHCNRKYQIRDELAGKVAKCQCGQNLTIPTPVQDGLTPLLDEESVGTAPSDPFAGIPDDVDSQGSSLAPLAPLPKKRRKRKKVDTFWIFLLGGGAGAVVLIGGLIFLVVTVVMQPRCGTPERAFNTLRKALMHEDWKTLYEVMTPDVQETMYRATVSKVPFAAPKSRTFKAICDKYGLERPELLDESKRSSAFAAVMDAFMDARTYREMGMPFPKDEMEKRRKAMTEGIKQFKLSNVEITGDRATGRLTHPDHPSSDTIEFQRIDGRWRIAGDEIKSGFGRAPW